MKYGYYPGCSLEGVSVEYDMSIRALFGALDVTIQDMAEWICCGTLAAPSISRLLGLVTPLWNVAKARQEEFDQLITPCSACLYHFKHATKLAAEHPNLRSEAEATLQMSLKDLPKTIHPLELLSNDGFQERIQGAVKRDLSNLKVVCYYGCHISRPKEVMQFDDPEYPQSMDRLLGWVGVETLDWSGKVNCCGAHFSMIKPDVAIDLCAGLVEAALEVGADAIAVACPMCHANLDIRQGQISTKLGRSISLPIVYFSQLLGYALGMEAKVLGFKKHLVDPLPLMLEKCKFRQVDLMPHSYILEGDI